jgi:hypothetical protein
MNHVCEFAMGECEGAHVAGVQRYGGIRGKVRALFSKGGWVAREDGEPGIETKKTVDVAEAFDEPAAKESGAAREEDALRAQFIPEWLRLIEDEIQISRRYLSQNHRWLLTLASSGIPLMRSPHRVPAS